MPYVKKTVSCGKVKFVKKYFASKHSQKKQEFRSTKSGKTSEAQEKINDKNKVERFSILANANFTTDDYFVTFTYKRENRPNSLDEARQEWNKVLRRLRIAYKKECEELKYLWCLEHKKYAWHFHLLANNAVNSKVFRSAWDFGKVHIENLDNREYHSVGEYMMKEQYIHEDDRKTKVQRCYGSSRNLFRPEAEVELLEDSNWAETPTEEEEWVLVEDSVDNGEVVIEGIDATFRYQSYIERYKSNDELLQELKKLNPYTKFNRQTDRNILLDEIRLLKGVA